MRQCHTGDGLTSISFRIASRLQLRAFVLNALCFRADCVFGFVYGVRAQIVLRSRQIVIRSRVIFWTVPMHCVSSVFLFHVKSIYFTNEYRNEPL